MTHAIYNANAGFTYTITDELLVCHCPECGVPHGVPAGLVEQVHKKRPCFSIYCPNGHIWGYHGPSAADRLVKERERSARLAAERDQAEASAKAQRGVATRARNERNRLSARVKAGTCPCCNRTFKQLARHMASQHPGFGPIVEGGVT